VGGDTPPQLPLRVSRSGSVATVSWSGSTQPADLLRGLIGELPVGPTSGDVGEVCLQDSTTSTFVNDADVPDSGAGFWYLVRVERGCGAESYGRGFRGSGIGESRYSSTCP
jgi:hypothetical protein